MLLGTQMIAKGLDFANVTLVGVIDADVGINLPDFRASERCFQLLSQVAGRAGRGPKGGQVFIQTRVPGHHAVRCAGRARLRGFHRGGAGRPAAAGVSAIGPARQCRVQRTDRGGDRGPCRTRSRLASTTRRARRRCRDIEVVGPAPVPGGADQDSAGAGTCCSRPSTPAALRGSAQYFVRRFQFPASDGLRMALDRDPVALL